MSVITSIKLNVDELEKVRRGLAEAKGSYAKVGVLGARAARQPGENVQGPMPSGSLTNPEIGIVHEKGSMTSNPPIPRRSFLEDPLVDHLPQKIRSVGSAAWAVEILQHGVRNALALLGVIGENVVQKGFETGGYGKWEPLSPYTIARKGSSAILIDTAQLRKSVTSEVVNA